MEPSADRQPASAAPATVGGTGKRRARPWHRVLGLVLALPLVWVVLTGAVLNHTVDWKLDQVMLDAPWLLRAYGMMPEGEATGIEVAGHLVADWDGVILVDGVAARVPGPLVGAVADGGGVVVVTASHVLRMDAAGEVLETMDELSLPDLPLTGVHADGGHVYLRNAAGWHRVEMDWLQFAAVERAFDVVPPRPLAAAEVDRLRGAWSGDGLPLSRVLLDGHAGRFLGRFSTYFYDLVALATLWLCGSGLILFFRKPRRSR